MVFAEHTQRLRDQSRESLICFNHHSSESSLMKEFRISLNIELHEVVR